MLPRDGAVREPRRTGYPYGTYVNTQKTFALEGAPHAMTSQVPIVRDRDGYREAPSYALWCASFLGFAGLHRIYLGKYATGILWLLT